MWRGAKIRVVMMSVLLSIVAASYALAENRYTPPHIWPDAWHTKFYEDWFGRELRAMGEPSLWQMSQSDKSARIYRMLELPALSAAYGASVIVQADGSAKVHITELGLGSEHNKPGKPKEKKVIGLEALQVRSLEALFARTGFWGNRIGWSERTDRKSEPPCLDGVQYVVEALYRGSYKFVTRHYCHMEDEILEILKALATLSGMPEPERAEF